MKLFYSLKKYTSKFSLPLIVIAVLLFATNAESTTRIINTSSNIFTPGNTSANVGDTIKWQWIEGTHNTTSGTIPSGAASWTGSLDAGNPVFTYVVSVAGTYNFECTFHPGMTGVITVSASLLTENFDYPAGDSLGAHGWVWINSAVNPLLVTSPGLTYAGYPLSNIGNATTVLATGEDSYKSMSAADSTGSLYVSFMINVTSVQAAGDYFMALLPANSTTLYTARFYARDTAGFRFGLSKSTAAAGGIFYTNSTYTTGTTLLVVIKVKFNDGALNDEYSAYIFNSGIPSVEPTTASIGPVTGTNADNSIGRVALRQGSATNAPVAIVDGIMVSKTWADIITSVQPVVNSVAESFTLSQNYPNPFNPNTTIKFGIPEKGFVNLIVYNSLGKEVSNLVNENLNQGSYSVNFNGSGLNSGVYFYKLIYSDSKGNNFVETKKLILLK